MYTCKCTAGLHVGLHLSRYSHSGSMILDHLAQFHSIKEAVVSFDLVPLILVIPHPKFLNGIFQRVVQSIVF